MQTSRIRGGTPIEYWGEQHRINDPQLTARLKEVGRILRLREAEHIQESIDAANAIFQPLPDGESPEPDESPIGGLPSPAASPPHTNLQLHPAQATFSAVSHPPSEPLEVELAGAKLNPSSSSLPAKSLGDGNPLSVQLSPPDRMRRIGPPYGNWIAPVGVAEGLWTGQFSGLTVCSNYRYVLEFPPKPYKNLSFRRRQETTGEE
ncbi:MAG: hypothetical protein Q9185_004558 [Variospora sp. 1 TL-2023]